MAKRKKSKTKIITYAKYGALLLAVVGAFMTLFNFVNFGDGGYTGIQVIFGYSTSTGGVINVTTQILVFSIVALLGVLLPIIGGVLALLKNKGARLVGSLLMITGAVLCFLMPNFIIFASNYVGQILNGSLGIGAILAGTMFSLGALCGLVSLAE